jgi:WD40-like Beta Propeller Repeat
VPDAAARSRRRRGAFVAIVGACVLLSVGAIVSAAVRTRGDHRRALRAAAAAAPSVGAVLASGEPHVLFRAAAPDHPGAGQLSIAALTPDGRPGRAFPLGMTCARVSFAAGQGLCLEQAGPVALNLTVLDSALARSGRLRLAGIPSRTRISPDGRLGVVTAFVRGDSYAAAGAFSTRTTIVDMTRRKALVDLERFTVTRDGEPVTAVDRNFWGVTFSVDGDTFFATMRTGGENYLIQGSIRERRAQTIRTEFECPSLSPDGTRIAYKHLQRLPGGVGWRIRVLDLASGKDVELAETASIDDQAVWLDDRRLVYGKGDDTWMANADGSGEAVEWIHGGVSPTIVRP